jgi:hypothetical protein
VAADPTQTIHATVFDSSDGVSSHRFTGGYNSVVAKSADGKLWFVRDVGVSVIDPHHLSFNELPPPVHIEQVTADDNIYDATNGLRLPPRIRNLAINYTALSFAAPEKVRFRTSWKAKTGTGTRSSTIAALQYTNLAPGTYRFRVMASNNSGVWNEAGDTLSFSIAPAYYQTRWFAAMWRWGSPRCCGRRINGASPARASVQSHAGRAGQRADAHRARPARHAAAELPGRAAALPVGRERRRDASRRGAAAAGPGARPGGERRSLKAAMRCKACGRRRRRVNDLANGIAAIGAELTMIPRPATRR